MKQDDLLWKAILEDVFDNFLVFFFGEEARQFDFEKGFVFMDKELEQLFPSGDDKASTKFVDKLVKVFTKAGTEEWILVHVKVQGYNDANFAKRMFTYFYRIFDHHDKAVTCIAVFTDSNKNFRPAVFRYNFLGTENIFRYNTYKIIDQDENELRKSNNPFALVILTALVALKKGEVTEDELLILKKGLLRMLFEKQIPKDKIRAILIFLYNYVRFDNAEIIAKFDLEIDLLTNSHTTMGIEQFILQRVRDEATEKAREKEKMEKNLAFVKALLIKNAFSAEEIADMVEVPVSFVESVKASLPRSAN